MELPHGLNTCPIFIILDLFACKRDLGAELSSIDHETLDQICSKEKEVKVCFSKRNQD